MSLPVTSHVTDHFTPFTTVDPHEPLDDLEPLAALFAQARVVAIGESAHYVREYTLLRHRITRFLVERCGFTVFALESGFSEGVAVDAWIRSGRGDLRTLADQNLTYRMGQSAEMRGHLAWMREAGVRYAGLDLPGSAATPLPLLERLRVALDGTSGRALVEDLITATGAFADEHALHTYAAYTALPRADRDALTAHWAELAAWCDTQVPGPPAATRHEVRLGVLFDQMLRGHAARSALMASARDRAMAETVFWLLQHHSDAKIVIGAANGHIQRTPVSLPGMRVSPAGHHLAQRLGEAYLSIAMTALGGHTPSRRADSSAPGGVAVSSVDLGAPRAGSIEAVLPGRLGVLDARGLRGLWGAPGAAEAPSAIRVQDGYLDGAVAEAHDFVVGVPLTSVSEQVGD
ncbi:erythromycin esterase family protein [Cryptosporangium aurantiacum]|uniref:Erythromycin esterase n=1 Tax=Cryptosporangium aurantiacum TaxID=134849 RepID=A0A1M7RNT4_9ACTN|nr:erythromycin esterase family protein [Cryptosporangium aurantiacum]SHN47879.1 erythromycin esterase [Cryptosporangium aurantiacum]